VSGVGKYQMANLVNLRTKIDYFMTLFIDICKRCIAPCSRFNSPCLPGKILLRFDILKEAHFGRDTQHNLFDKHPGPGTGGIPNYRKPIGSGFSTGGAAV
jgi:hypothetical protein